MRKRNKADGEPQGSSSPFPVCLRASATSLPLSHILVFQGCRNRSPQKQQKCMASHFWKLEAMLPLKAVGQSPSLGLPSFQCCWGDPWHSLVCICSASVCLHGHMAFSLVCLCLLSCGPQSYWSKGPPYTSRTSTNYICNYPVSRSDIHRSWG